MAHLSCSSQAYLQGHLFPKSGPGRSSREEQIDWPHVHLSQALLASVLCGHWVQGLEEGVLSFD